MPVLWQSYPLGDTLFNAYPELYYSGDQARPKSEMRPLLTMVVGRAIWCDEAELHDADRRRLIKPEMPELSPNKPGGNIFGPRGFPNPVPNDKITKGTTPQDLLISSVVPSDYRFARWTHQERHCLNSRVVSQNRGWQVYS